jgi:IS5 family transposase
MKRRATIEADINHLKREHCMDRNRLKSIEGGRLKAILSASGMYFHKLLRWAAEFLRQIFLWLLFYQRTMAIKVSSILWLFQYRQYYLIFT